MSQRSQPGRRDDDEREHAAKPAEQDRALGGGEHAGRRVLDDGEDAGKDQQ